MLSLKSCNCKIHHSFYEWPDLVKFILTFSHRYNNTNTFFKLFKQNLTLNFKFLRFLTFHSFVYTNWSSLPKKIFNRPKFMGSFPFSQIRHLHFFQRWWVKIFTFSIWLSVRSSDRIWLKILMLVSSLGPLGMYCCVKLNFDPASFWLTLSLSLKPFSNFLYLGFGIWPTFSANLASV